MDKENKITIPKWLIVIMITLLVAFSSFVFAWGSINNRVDAIEGDIQDQKSVISDYGEKVNSYETNYAVVSQKIDDIADDIREIKADVKELSKR